MIGAKLKTILNFLPVRAGGGLQNALSFLEVLGKDTNRSKAFIAVVRCNTQIHKTCKEYNIEHIAIDDSFMGRIRFELKCKSYFSKGQVCFTFFGPPMMGSKNYLVNVVGCAYSNLFYPEINFWGCLPFQKRQKKKFIDYFRKKITAMSDYWIFETPVLAKRAVELCNFPNDRVGVVKMTASNLVSPEKVKSDLSEKLKARLPTAFKFLLLASGSPHKQQHLLCGIAEELHRQGEKNFCFVTTMNERASYAKEILRDFKQKKLDQHIYNIGPIPPGDVATLIEACEAMCCFSILESFSNNFVEAWKMNKPLIVTDADWSLDACGKGGLYVNPRDSKICAKQLQELMNTKTLRDTLITAGKKQLDTYPDCKEKNLYYLQHLAIAEKSGFCLESQRKMITWPKITSKK